VAECSNSDARQRQRNHDGRSSPVQTQCDDFSRLAHFTRCQCGNRNGVIDAADYVVWRNNASAPGTSTAIPEPAAAAIATMAAVLVPHLFSRVAKRSEYSTSHVVHP
jgi:hypothetical protein